MVHENGFPQRVMVSDDAPEPGPDRIRDVGTRLYCDSHRRRGRLMQEIRVMFDGELFVLDVAKKSLDFFKSDGVGLPAVSGFLEISGERPAFDFQDFEAALEFLRGRLANLCDLGIKFFKLGFDLQDFFLKQRWGFRLDGVHG